MPVAKDLVDPAPEVVARVRDLVRERGWSAARKQLAIGASTLERLHDGQRVRTYTYAAVTCALEGAPDAR